MKRKMKQNAWWNSIHKKNQVMITEKILSNRNVVIGILVAIDLFLFMGLNYLSHMLINIPKFLFGKSQEYFSFRYLLPVKASPGLFLAFLVLCLVVDVVLWYRIKVSWSEEYFNVNQKGRSRWTTEEEIKETYLQIDPLETPYPGNPGTLISRIGEKFYIDQDVVNNLVLGMTRSGKGESLVKTNLEIYTRAERQPSLVINDPKLELYKTFKRKFEQRGYKVELLNVEDPLHSMGFNLLEIAVNYYRKKDQDMAEMVLNSLGHSLYEVAKSSGDMKYFVEQGAAAFTAMAYAMMEDAFAADKMENDKRFQRWSRLSKEEQEAHPFRYRRDNEKTINLYSLFVTFQKLVSQPITKDGSKTMLDWFFEQRDDFDPAKLKYLGVEIAPGKTKSSIFSEMLKQLSKFTLRNVAKMTAESTLDFEELGYGETPIAVFLAVPSYDDSLHSLPIIWIRQMYYVLGKRMGQGKGKCDRQVKLILDEAGNMPSVELMGTMISMGLGQNISMDLYLQNYEQLDQLYGKELAQTIRGNCGNHYFLQTNSEETARSFSNSLGSKSYVNVSRGGAKLSTEKYYTESVEEKPLLNPNELMELMPGENVIFRRSKRQDLKGEKVVPRPFFNSVENGHYFWYAYEFFPKKDYLDPNSVDFLTICDESREHIEPRERVWDVEKSIWMLKHRKETCLPIKREQYQKLRKNLQELLGVDYETRYGISAESSRAELAGFLEGLPISEAEKDSLLAQI